MIQVHVILPLIFWFWCNLKEDDQFLCFQVHVTHYCVALTKYMCLLGSSRVINFAYML
jgi:hypothetical protein